MRIRSTLIIATILCATGLVQQVRSQSLPDADDPVHHPPAPVLTAPDSVTLQLVDSRKGFVIRIPATARIDSARSGWNPAEMYERRVFVIPAAGEIMVTATIGETTVPETATVTAAYTFDDAETITSAGTAYSRTYYMPHRAIRIDFTPYGVDMRAVIDAREKIYGSFRWKPGASGEEIDVERPPAAEIERPVMQGFGE